MKTSSPPFRLVVLLLTFSLPLSVGCGSSSGPPASRATTATQHDDDHDAEHDERAEHDEHEHEHEHDHHHVAAHRPQSYADLVHQLQIRPGVIRGEADHDMEHARHELAELHDIINWLPAIAADTDLGKRDWDTASMTSRELLAIVPRSAVEFVSAFRPGSPAAAEYERCVARLSELVPRAERDLARSAVTSTAVTSTAVTSTAVTNTAVTSTAVTSTATQGVD